MSAGADRADSGCDVLDLVLGTLDGVRQHGGYWMARCPAHDDHKASLSVARGKDQPVVLNCHAGCDPATILDAAGLSWADVSANGHAPPDDKWTPAGTAIATYPYTDAKGTVLFGVCRTADKQFRQWRPDPTKEHGRAWSLQGVKRVLYRLPQVMAAIDAGETVYVVEGEKDVHAMEADGVTATCNPGGTGGGWKASYSKTLAGAEVVIVADNDPPGVEHARKVAESLDGVAASVRMVRAREGKDAADHLAAGYGPGDFTDLALDDAEPEPPPRPAVIVGRADGAAILDDTEAAYRRYVAWANEAQPVAAALWTAHSHAIDAADTTPYLDISSPEPESGKTRVLEVIELLGARAWMLVEPSEAAMFRKIARDNPTVLLDEYDALWSGKADGREALRALLNAGYRRGATVPRCIGDGSNTTVEDFPVFGAKALAGLSGKLPRTIATRSIPIRLQRRAKSQQVERFRFGEVRAALGPLHDRLAAWAELLTPELHGAKPPIPAGLSDRQADCWEPLLAIADAAGGHWPQRGRDASTALHGADPAADPGTGVLLLAHIKATFEDAEAEWLSTVKLLHALVDRDDGPWANWWEKNLAEEQTKGPAGKLAYLLKPFGIAPKLKKDDGKPVRGYELAQFRDTFDRYSASFPKVTTETEDETLPRYPAGQAMFDDSAMITPQGADLGGNEVTSGNRAKTLPGKNHPAETGPCVVCGQPCRRYGHGASPLCPACQAASRRNQPADSGATEHGDWDLPPEPPEDDGWETP
jgi:Protein of unknown function (DUF3631)